MTSSRKDLAVAKLNVFKGKPVVRPEVGLEAAPELDAVALTAALKGKGPAKKSGKAAVTKPAARKKPSRRS